MASTSITSTTGAVNNPAITSKDVIEFRKANLAFSGTVSTRYKDEARVGTTIRWGQVTLLNSGSARAKSEGNNNTITKDVNTEVAITLTINSHYYQAFELEEFEEALSTVDQRMWYTRAASYVIDKQVDTALAALPSGFSNTVGALTVPLADADIRRGDQYLNDANAPDDGRFLGISPATKATMLGIDRYASSDFIGGNGGVNIVRGEFGTVYGYRVFVSTNINGSNSAGHDNTMHQRDAMALALRQQPKVHEFDDISNLSHTTAISVIYGVVETRDDHGVYMKGE